MTGVQVAYDLPSEECLMLVCSYIDSLIVAGRTASSSPPLPSAPNESSPPQPPRRSLDYVAERPNGYIASISGEEYGIGVGYDEVAIERQRRRIARRFTSKTIPQIPINQYLERIRKYNDVRTPMLLTLAIYLDRMESPRLNEYNVHRFVLAGLRIAAKFLEDLVWKHDRYSKVVGVTTRELSRLELGFLFLMEFEIVVSNEQLSDMALRLRKDFGH